GPTGPKRSSLRWRLEERTVSGAPPSFEGDVNRLTELSRRALSDPGLNVERIHLIEVMLSRLINDEAPSFRADLLDDLGNSYADLPTGDRVANLERAIACYTEALRFRTPEAAPLDYAGTQNNVGMAYADLPSVDWGANLDRAIACYTEALRFYTPE